MHLSPVKGAFPHKDQHDRTAPVVVTETNKAIERGTVIRYNAAEKGFELAEDATVFPMYLALQNYGDLQATMAGMYSPSNGQEVDFPFAPGSWKKPRAAHAPSKGMTGRDTATQPAITGIHMDDGDVWETDMFDEEGLKDLAPNDKLTVKDGLITAAGEGDNVVGFLVEAPYRRYANDAVAVKGMMTGAYIQVIQFQCGK